MRAIAVLILMTISATGQAAGPKLVPAVAEDLERAIERGDARAIAVGLYDNGETRFYAFGRLGRDDDGLPSADSLFEIGSISKVFTALLTQVQADAGRLDWGDTIGQRLPDTEFASAAVAKITLRELSAHTSGLPRLPDNFDPPDPMNPYAGYERSDLLDFLTGFETEALVKEYAYSNLGAGLLGELAADAAGADYAEAMRRDVLLPLGMGDSSVQIRDDRRSRMAEGFSDGADMPNWGGFDALAGAADLERYPGAYQIAEGFVLSISVEDGRLYAQATGQAQFPLTAGETDEFVFPAADVRIVFEPAGRGAAEKLTLYQGGQVMPAPRVAVGAGPQERREIALPASQLNDYVGEFRFAPGAVLTVVTREGQLYAQLTGQAAFPVFAYEADRFFYKVVDAQLHFERDDDGSVAALVLHQGGEQRAPKIE